MEQIASYFNCVLFSLTPEETNLLSKDIDSNKILQTEILQKMITQIQTLQEPSCIEILIPWEHINNDNQTRVVGNENILKLLPSLDNYHHNIVFGTYNGSNLVEQMQEFEKMAAVLDKESTRDFAAENEDYGVPPEKPVEIEGRVLTPEEMKRFLEVRFPFNK
jgi:hypothetical protein